MAIRYIVEIVADDSDKAVVTEHTLSGLAGRGLFVSALSVKDSTIGKPDVYEMKYPLNVALITRYAEARKGEE